MKLFGEDFLDYVYRADHGTVVAEHSDPRSFSYDHDLWEASYEATCQERSMKKPLNSAESLKQLVNGTSSKSQVPSSDLDGITRLEEDPLPQCSHKPPPNGKSAVLANTHQTAIQVDLVSQTLVRENSIKPSSTKHQTSYQVIESTTTNIQPSAVKVCSVQVANQPKSQPLVHVQHGLLLNNSGLFHISASCGLPDNLFTLVNNLVEGLVSFGGSVLIDRGDLVALRGCSPTSEERYLTNFTIEGYLNLIAKEGMIQGRKVEYLGWERFEKAVGRNPAQDVLRGKGPLLQQDVVLVPCNPQGSQHWFLLAVLPNSHQILVLDSLAGEYVKPTAKKAINKMWMLLVELDSSIGDSHWNCYSNKPTDIPQQHNDYDCGVFLCMYARTLALQHPMPAHIPSFRQVMIMELHQGTLHSLATE